MLNDNSNMQKYQNESITEEEYKKNINSLTESNKIQLPADILKQLCDKNHDKRKYGMKELENFIRYSVNFRSDESIRQIISNFISLSDISQPQYARKAAFLGYTTLANVLLRETETEEKHKDTNNSHKEINISNSNLTNNNWVNSNSLNNRNIMSNTFNSFHPNTYASNFNASHVHGSNTNIYEIYKIISMITNNILSTFKDNDPKVVCSAAESLYNIMKYFPDFIMNSFNDIFKGLLLITVNPDQEVRTLANNLDSLLKEIVNFSFQDNQLPLDFNIKDFFEKIYEKITTKHPSIKIMIVSWIIFINSIPEIKIINVLHEILPYLFNMLSEKNKEVSQKAEECLKDLLKEIEIFFETLFYDVEVKILEILIEQCKSLHDQTRHTAFEWINSFLSKYKYFLIQSKRNRTPYTKSLIIPNKISNANFKSGMQMIPDFSSSNYDIYENISRTDESNFGGSVTETGEKKIPFNLFPKILDVVIASVNHTDPEIKKISNFSNSELLAIIDFFGDSHSANIKLYEEVLRNYLNMEEKDSTIELVLSWINKLFKKFHEEMFTKLDNFIDKICSVLMHPNDVLFNMILDLICEIARYKDENKGIDIIITKILDKLSENTMSLNDKGLCILKKFCLFLNVERVYSTFADVLLRMKQTEFVEKMINILGVFLVTNKETEQLRKFIRNIKKNNSQSEKQFFEKLFSTWCYNPVSSIILCFMAEYFDLSKELNLEQETYIELSQLVQLLESSVFMRNSFYFNIITDLRLYLLEPRKNIFLVKSLFGILLLLPQGKAYQALYKRIKHIEVIYKLENVTARRNKTGKNVINIPLNNSYDINEITHYLDIFEAAHSRIKLENPILDEIVSDEVKDDYFLKEEKENPVSNITPELAINLNSSTNFLKKEDLYFNNTI